ncbi:MAG: hypothetical protein CSA66_04335 [Proteobacteria bacterium]|nr:MAG: hypothetical protein CSA66_04335 [Pseudomonadota bacterium]
MKNRRTTLAATLLALAPLTPLTGCDDGGGDVPPCVTPAGTYTMEVAYVGGDCDDELVAKVLAKYPRDVTVDGEVCGYYEREERSSGEVCDAHAEITATATASGFEDGTLSVGLDCDHGYSCSAYFNAYWARR